MLNVRANPIGIDTEIQSIETDLYNALIVKWVDKLQAFGRIYKDIDNDTDALKPYWYVDEDEYKEVYYDDKFSGTFFFINDDNHLTEDGFNFTSVVKCVFMLNLSEVLAAETDRSDSKAQMHVVNILREISFGKFDIVGIEKGLSNVFSGLDFSGVKFEDQHPNHCFSVNIALSYYLDDGCTIITNLQ